MASKLEYLKRYMSGAPGGEAEDKKKRKSKKKRREKDAQRLGTRVVDADHEWEQDAPSRDAIEQNWEAGGGDDELPVVVADGDVVMDPQDLPVYVNSDEFLGELQAKNEAAARGKDEDLSPPRKAPTRSMTVDSDGGASPPRRPPRQQRALSGSEQDLSPPRKQKSRFSRREDSDASPPRVRGGRQDGDGSVASPPRERGRKKGEDSDASPPRARRRSNQDDSDASPPRARRKASDASPHRRDRSRRGSERESSPSPPPRSRQEDRPSMNTRRDGAHSNSGDASPPRRGKRTEPALETLEIRGRGREVSSITLDIGKNEDKEERRSPQRDRGSFTRERNDRQRRVDSLGRDTDMRDDHSRRKRRSPSPNDRSRQRRSRSADRRNRSPSRDHSRSRSQRRSSRRERSRSTSRYLRHDRDRNDSGRRRLRSPSPSQSRSRSPRRRETSRGQSPTRNRSSSREHRSSRRSVSSRRDDRSHRSPTAVKLEERHGKARTAKHSPTSHRSPMRERRGVPSDTKTETKPRAGLFTAKQFEENQKIAARSRDLLHGVDASEMGANAETVYRDKRGRKLDMLNEMMRQQEIVEGKRKREAREEYEWGTGKVQKQERESQQEQLNRIKAQPFARHDDDEDLERMRKERVRAFDPMNSKVFQDDAALHDGTKKKKSKKSGKKGSKPAYAGPPAPPNRFGIRPGYRWDGVMRGNGWEEKVMLRQNSSNATDEEMYKYAVADM